MSALRIDVADLLAHAGARRGVTVSETVDGLSGSAARVDGPVRADLTLERISDGIVVRGTVRAGWRAQCSVCLRDLERVLEVHVDELFEAESVEGETYPIEGHELDLEQLVRDALLLDLPLAPHCEDPCEPARPLSAADDDAPIDPRWAALSELEL
jgi:uncharacterized protein